MAVSEARKRANQKWSDKTYKIKTFRLHLKHDADILEYLDTKESVNRYLNQRRHRTTKERGRVGPFFVM